MVGTTTKTEISYCDYLEALYIMTIPSLLQQKLKLYNGTTGYLAVSGQLRTQTGQAF